MLYNEDGVTIIEILFALVILSFVTASVLLLFNNTLTTIFSTGHKSQGLYKAQADMENKIINSEPDEELLPITVPGMDEPIYIKGREITVDVTVGNTGRTISLSAFVPND